MGWWWRKPCWSQGEGSVRWWKGCGGPGEVEFCGGRFRPPADVRRMRASRSEGLAVSSDRPVRWPASRHRQRRLGSVVGRKLVPETATPAVELSANNYATVPAVWETVGHSGPYLPCPARCESSCAGCRYRWHADEQLH